MTPDDDDTFTRLDGRKGISEWDSVAVHLDAVGGWDCVTGDIRNRVPKPINGEYLSLGYDVVITGD
jgi:hypothetical protein